MANNRMMIRCTTCGEEIVLAKHMGGEWEIYIVMAERVNDFFEEHFLCGTGDKHYELVFEDGE